jgi:hypothetical protein
MQWNPDFASGARLLSHVSPLYKKRGQIANARLPFVFLVQVTKNLWHMSTAIAKVKAELTKLEKNAAEVMTKSEQSTFRRLYLKPIKALISEESWKRQLTQIERLKEPAAPLPPKRITIGKSHFNWTFKITSGPPVFVHLFWFVTGTSKLAEAVGKQPLVKVEIMYAGETRSHLGELYVFSAISTSVYTAATNKERTFLQGLGRRSLCHALHAMKQKLPIAPKGYLSLFPYSVHRTGFNVRKLEEYYARLGFKPNPKAAEDVDEDWSAPFSVLLKNCGL